MSGCPEVPRPERRHRVLLVHGDRLFREAFAGRLAGRGFAVEAVADEPEALALIQAEPPEAGVGPRAIFPRLPRGLGLARGGPGPQAPAGRLLKEEEQTEDRAGTDGRNFKTGGASSPRGILRRLKELEAGGR